MSIAVCALQIFTHSIDNGTLWLIVTMLFLIDAGYGGGFSTLPMLLEQHFGMKSVSTVHGLALSAWAFAGLSGNQLASFVVSHATDAAHRYSALIPIITILGSTLPNLFGGAMITETLFQIPGIGYTSYQALTQGDIPFTMFYMVFLAFLTLTGNLIADILYAVADPRVRVN